MRGVKPPTSVDFSDFSWDSKYKRILGGRGNGMSRINGETCGDQKLNCRSNLNGCSTHRSAFCLISFPEQNKWFFSSVPRIVHKKKV